MNKEEKLVEILKKIENISPKYYNRSLCALKKEAMNLYDIIIQNPIQNFIEIGTCNGLSATVFASIIDGNVYTINVNDDEIENAKKLWNDLGIKNIIQIKGNSLDVLPKLLLDVNNINFILIDGNHNIPYAAKEFEIIKNSKVKDNDCLVYFHDDWSDGVKQAVDKYDLKRGKHSYYYVFGDFII